MQKVSKELLAALEKRQISYPNIDRRNAQSWDLTQMDTLVKLVKLREIIQLEQLAKVMAEKMGGGKSLFDVWMKEESDLIQATSKSFGERIALEETIKCAELEADKGVK